MKNWLKHGCCPKMMSNMAAGQWELGQTLFENSLVAQKQFLLGLDA